MHARHATLGIGLTSKPNVCQPQAAIERDKQDVVVVPAQPQLCSGSQAALERGRRAAAHGKQNGLLRGVAGGMRPTTAALLQPGVMRHPCGNHASRPRSILLACARGASARMPAREDGERPGSGGASSTSDASASEPCSPPAGVSTSAPSGEQAQAHCGDARCLHAGQPRPAGCSSCNLRAAASRGGPRLHHARRAVEHVKSQAAQGAAKQRVELEAIPARLG